MTKTIIITGAAHGLGKAFAIGLSRAGYNIVLAGRNQAQLDATASRLEGEFLTQQCDITQLDDCQQLISAAKNKFDTIDILINNAGIYTSTSFVDTPAEQLNQVFNTVVTGTAQLSKLALEAMAIQKSGHIISILDIATTKALPDYKPDAPSSLDLAVKAAKDEFTKVLRREAETHNVAVTAFYMKYVASNLDIDDTESAPNGATHPADAVKYMLQTLNDRESEFELPPSYS